MDRWAENWDAPQTHEAIAPWRPDFTDRFGLFWAPWFSLFNEPNIFYNPVVLAFGVEKMQQAEFFSESKWDGVLVQGMP